MTIAELAEEISAMEQELSGLNDPKPAPPAPSIASIEAAHPNVRFFIRSMGEQMGGLA